VGASGTRPGLILADGADIGPDPTAFVANTVKVYATPLVSPVIVAVRLAVVVVKPLGCVTIVYRLIGEPLRDAAFQDTVEIVSPGTATTLCGAPGRPT